MDFITGLSILIDWKRNSYNAIFVIVNCLTKMIYYKPVKTTIDAAALEKIMINMIERYYEFSKSIISD